MIGSLSSLTYVVNILSCMEIVLMGVGSDQRGRHLFQIGSELVVIYFPVSVPKMSKKGLGSDINVLNIFIIKLLDVDVTYYLKELFLGHCHRCDRCHTHYGIL